MLKAEAEDVAITEGSAVVEVPKVAAGRVDWLYPVNSAHEFEPEPLVVMPPAVFELVMVGEGLLLTRPKYHVAL